MKKTIRKLINVARKWVQDDGRLQQASEFSYHWLNRVVFPKILDDENGAFRPHYTWGLMQGVNLAKKIGISHVSAIEFGVAGGNGLVSLERTAEKLEHIFGMRIDVIGFDSGGGLPKPEDYRDLPNIYSEGRYPMDVDKLKSCLKKAQIILGLVEDTIEDFIKSGPPPVAFVSFDLDLYSSTMSALQLLSADETILLPRIVCYFDDIMGLTFSDFAGERLAISEFNSLQEMRKISQIYGLKYFLPSPYRNQMWTEMVFMAHVFDHELYDKFDGLEGNEELCLTVE